MLVKDWMTKNVSIDHENTVIDAIKIMKEKDVSRLPVTKGGKLVGILTNKDIKKASPSDATMVDPHELAYLISNLRVRKIMTSPVITVSVDNSVGEATETLLHRNVSGAPVIDRNNEVVGVISRTDLTKLLLSLTGMGAFGLEIGLLVKDEPGTVKRLTDLIKEFNGRIRSVLSTYENAPEGYKKLFVKLFEFRGDQVDTLIDEFSKTARVEYLVDHINSKRVIF